MIEFNQRDIRQIEEKGISKKTVEDQIRTFMEGIPNVSLYAPAVVGDGILRVPSKEKERYIRSFEKAMNSLSLLKFVPASGAASRMFRSLFAFLEGYNPGEQSLDSYLKKNKDSHLVRFFEQVSDFPFYDLVLRKMGIKELSSDEDKYHFVQELLSEDGLNYGFYPKGLLPFHKYGEHLVTPFEEHLFEGVEYARVKNRARLHFTISEPHQSLFDQEWEKIGSLVEKETGTSFDVGYSYQSQATDTIAVTPENEPFRNEDGSVLFRPGGHGALLRNLNAQDADIIFIKNIDNVVTRDQSEDTAASKKLLAGVLLDLQNKVFRYAELLESNSISGGDMEEIRDFLERDLNVRFSDSYGGFTIGQQIEILKDKLHRPLRVCGMVKNQGEPGGGPFWVRDRNGNVSLQIVESAQVDLEREHQAVIFSEATHFNPVDIVCGVKDHKGEKFDLLRFQDEKQGFITGKTQEGKPLKALELPGLWNGGMAYWNTIFVEVPISTFNPVKTVNDLLKPAHQV
ncbi:protein of unknown function [Muriicola jejuensis]|uniref:DUF4301 family protein n=1 Tax=Muriicola jejuensis TaxID=504488 RepID=A0A6P0UGA9_9FLAO|nr:DUF4301 family protein [Muriicola jejuensis]NER10253.1 DUF4301 family protein [Muriicola jejuensis]SMP01724.1 protein of unknown function [Muriicola jejuensis]